VFLYNSMWAWNPSSSLPDGVILHAAGCPLDRAEVRDLPNSRNDYTLFDPNSYLWELDEGDCGRAVECVTSYPWVPEEPLRTNVELMSDDQVTATLRAVAEWQAMRGATRVILPTPLIADPSGTIDDFLRWADLAIKLSPEVDRPVLLAVGLSEVTVATHFGTVLDQLTARPDTPGVYAFVETSRSSGRLAVNQEVARALLMTSYFVGRRLGKEVVINFADTFGLACLAVGASAFATGYERKGRSLDFEHFEERNGGGAFPKFFSLATSANYRPERDMERIRNERLLRLLTSDRTASSASLFLALEEGRSASEVPDWRESRSNVAAARAHLIERLCSAVDELSAIPNSRDKVFWALNWLQDAERNVGYLNSRFEHAPLDDDGRHVGAWRAAFETFVEEFGLA